MKIVFTSFMDGKQGGGSARVAEWLVESFANMGHEVIFVTTGPECGLQLNQDNGISKYVFRPFNLYWVGHKDNQAMPKKIIWQMVDLWNWHTYRVVRRILQQEKPDIVHIHKLRGMSPSLFSAARDVGCSKIIHTLHDHELISPEGTLHGRIGQLVKKNALSMQAYQVLRRRYAKDAHHVTSPSRYLLKMVTERGFFRHAQQCIIPNSHGLSLGELRQKRQEIAVAKRNCNKRIRLLYLGRLDEMKGIDFFCQAFLDAWQLAPSLHLDIVGFGSSSGRLSQLGQHPAISFHGSLWGAEKQQIISQCDIMVVPSISPENAPLTILEAYIYGKPIIASNIGGIPELIVENKTGLLLPAGNQSSWISMLVLLANNPNQIDHMPYNCFDQAEKYTQEAVISAFQQLYSTSSTS